MKTLFTFILFTGLAASLLAQETIDVLSLTGRYGIPSGYQDNGYEGKATEWGSVNSLTAGFKVAKNTKLAINLNHFYFNVQGEPEPDFPSDIANPIKVNGILLRMGIQQFFSKDRTLLVLAGPMLMSDFQNISSESWQLGAMATFNRRYSERFKIGFGAMYITQLFGPYLVPILDLNWQFGERWRLSGMIPISARVSYSVNDNMSVGYNHFGLITSYALGADAYAGDYIERQSIDESLFIRHRIAGNIFMEFMAGRALGRKYRQYEGDQKVDFAIPLVTFGDDREIKNEYAAFDDGFIFTLKLILNMPIPE